jgi:phosphosulfolactate synthase (CoM biosynthesis protein A)
VVLQEGRNGVFEFAQNAPRAAGMTMIIDTGLGVSATADILKVAGDYIDLWKLSFGTAIFVRPVARLLQERPAATQIVVS